MGGAYGDRPQAKLAVEDYHEYREGKRNSYDTYVLSNNEISDKIRDIINA
ncbi:hypothetical protein OfM2_14690 [Lactovum odontotermitis]